MLIFEDFLLPREGWTRLKSPTRADFQPASSNLVRFLENFPIFPHKKRLLPVFFKNPSLVPDGR